MLWGRVLGAVNVGWDGRSIGILSPALPRKYKGLTVKGLGNPGRTGAGCGAMHPAQS